METYEGLYDARYERSAFRICGEQEELWTFFWTGDPYAFFVATGFDPDGNWEYEMTTRPRFLRVQGEVQRIENPKVVDPSQPRSNGFGHMSAYPGQIDVYRLIEARDATDEDLERCGVRRP